MKMNKWTLGLAALGLVSLSSVVQAEEKSAPLAALSGTTISGYVDTSAYFNPGTGDANPAPFAFNAGKQNGFNLDSVDLKIAKPLDEAQWSAGYTLELMFGPDAPNINGGNAGGSGIGNSIRQAYVALRAPVCNGIDFKIGRFDTIIGYESNDNYKNPNFTHSYGYSMLPFENTGVLAESKLAEWISVAAGVANTVNTSTFINGRDPVEGNLAYMGNVTLTAPESMGFLAGSAVYAGAMTGFGNLDTANNSGAHTTDVYAGATVATPLKGLRLGFAYTEVHNLPQTDTFGLPVADIGSNQGYANSFAGYASFQATEKLSLHARAEYAKGPFGTVFGTVEQADADALTKVFALTGTVQYDLWQNVISRLEVRWDHACDGKDAFGTNEGAPSLKNAVMLAANVIYKF